ncbi:MAG: HlyD family efflux transporter periplasmic adaptor subunit [Proteobacteria bacterium]|nr:HlyD family efflux transporter periplasmic adaptor subunit [Pseudomonadota bacterium]
MDARTDAAPPVTGSAPPGARPLTTEPKAAAGRRQKLFTWLGLGIAAAAAAWGAYWVLVASHHVDTDNAYVQADTAQVTPLVSAAILSAPAGDTQVVKKGDVLVTLDPTDARIALAQAQADLAQAERRVQGYFATNDAQAANTAARGADIVRAQAQVESAKADFERARTDLTRRQNLAASGAVSGDELTAAQNRFDQARAALASAQAAVAQAQANRAAAVGQQRVAAAMVAGSTVASNPEVAAARAKVDAAQLDLDRTVIRAPIDGVVAKNTAEVGQRVQAGAPLMSIVPVQHAYVDANFKEVQLKHVRVGQPAVLTSDLYGGGVKFHGVVTGVAGGTGSAFAIIPAQNATGNWIKVVQRLPVRIALDPAELAKHPLRVGLSMKVDIDTNR